MEKPGKILFFIFGIVLYCATLNGFSINPNHHSQQEQIKETAESSPSFSEELPYMNAFAVKESSLFILFVKTNPEPSQKKEVYKAAMQAHESKFSSALIHYLSQLSLSPVRIRKSDMLFPFHYFFEADLI